MNTEKSDEQVEGLTQISELRTCMSSKQCNQTPGCDGTLSNGTYKGNSALICDKCGVPTIQSYR